MNIISFSVWGNDPFYVKGIKENIDLAKEYYPGWKCKIYYDSSFDITAIPEDVKKEAIFEHIPVSRGKWDGLFWRFYPASDPNVNILIVRDLDSRLNSREAAAVNEWLNSSYDFHGMRDHIQHNVRIMGGMWGCRNKVLANMVDLINNWKDFDSKGTDQNFLSERVWPHIRDKCIFHDRYNKNLYITPDNEHFTQDDIAYYNPFNNCGAENDTNFPLGKIVFKNEKTFRREVVYEYIPNKLFGYHNIMPFPPHEPMKHGTCVGDYVK